MRTPPLGFSLLTALLGAATAYAAGCGGDDAMTGACADGEQSLAFLEPMDGAMLGPDDDVDPSMGGLQTQIGLRACGFLPEDQIGVFLLDPFETAYAYLPADDGTPAVVVPWVPGMLRLQARNMEETVVSEIITIDVTVD